MKVAISQSNYIPWKGYFDLIASVDVFVIYDDMQYTKRDWRNRNKIVSPLGLKWLTIPVEVSGKYYQKINQTKVADELWARKHLQQFTQNYKQSAFFNDIYQWLEIVYERSKDLTMLTDINTLFISEICAKLDINTTIKDSREFKLVEDRSDRLASICESLDAKTYVSGPAAKDYLDLIFFDEKDISVSWFDYSNYPPYRQLSDEFNHGVSILDLMFNTGPDATKYMKHSS